MTTKREITMLVVLTFTFLFYTLIGSFITTGSITSLLLIITLVCYLIQCAIIKIQDRKK